MPSEVLLYTAPVGDILDLAEPPALGAPVEEPTMKAALLQENGSVSIAEHPRPAAQGQAVIRVRAAGVCGTELHFQDGILKPEAYPFILGHEISGVVEELTGEELGFHIGDRVTVYNLLACGACKQCRLGRDELCDAASGQLGFNRDGGFAEFVRAPLSARALARPGLV